MLRFIFKNRDTFTASCYAFLETNKHKQLRYFKIFHFNRKRNSKLYDHCTKLE